VRSWSGGAIIRRPRANGFRLENNTARSGEAIIGGSVVIVLCFSENPMTSSTTHAEASSHARFNLSALGFDAIKSQLVSETSN
jgi:hypothetical protein